MNRLATFLARIAATAATLAAMSASADLRYRAVDLASAVGASAVPVAINDDGLVAVTGFADGESFSLLYDIASGQVVYRFPAGDRVAALTADGDAAGSGVDGTWLWRDGVRTVLPLQRATGLNDAGLVAGFGGGFFPRAMVYDSRQASITDLGTLGGTQSVALAINARGQITGSSNTSGNQSTHAFLWQDGVMQDLGTLGGDGDSVGNAINAAGRVVGMATTASGEGRAFLFAHGSMSDLGSLPACARSVATAINGRGDVAGVSDLCATNASRAFVFFDGAIFDVNDLAGPPADGFVYARATGINSGRALIGIATTPDGFTSRPFLLVAVN